MTNHELEQILSRYEPRTPPAGLGPRILDAAARVHTVSLAAIDWSLMLSAAALVVAAIYGSVPQVAALDAEERRRQERVEEFATIGGNDDMAQQLADVFVPHPYVELYIVASEEMR